MNSRAFGSEEGRTASIFIVLPCEKTAGFAIDLGGEGIVRRQDVDMHRKAPDGPELKQGRQLVARIGGQLQGVGGGERRRKWCT